MLYVVPTPIGNLEDITLRAVRLFSQANIIMCEDSRETRKLMNLLKIENKPEFVDLTRNHNFNWSGIEKTLEKLVVPQANELIVLLVSDSGMPGISDPGREVIEQAIEKQIQFTVLPGASAVVNAAVASGFVSKNFEFMGFLPIKKGRQTAWKEIAEKQVPVIIYESSHRIKKFIDECPVYLQPNRQICICNDFSKLHEKFWWSRVEDLNNLTIPEKGEFAVIINSMNHSKAESEE